MHSCVNRMSQNSTQGARVLPGACAVLTCVFDCMCYFSTEHEQHACTPCCFLGHSINTRMQVDSTCIVLTRVYPCCFLGHSINTRMQVDSTCIVLTHYILNPHLKQKYHCILAHFHTNTASSNGRKV